MNYVLRVVSSLGLVLTLAASIPADEPGALKSLAERSLKAVGGAKVQAVRAWILTMKRTERAGDREELWHSGVFRLYVQPPDYYRSEFECKFWMDDAPVRTIVVVKKQKGWRCVSATGKTEELSTKEIADYKQTIRLQYLWICGAALLSDPSSRLTSLPETRIGDQTAVGVRLTHKEYWPIRLYFDKDTALLLKSERNKNDDDRLGRSSEMTYSDFRRVGGILVPHKRTYKAEGPSRSVTQVEGIGTVKIETHLSPVNRLDELTELRFADKLDPKFFEKP